MGAKEQQFQEADKVDIYLALLNRHCTKLHSNLSKLYRILPVKGVLATMEDPETEGSILVYVASLAISSPL